MEKTYTGTLSHVGDNITSIRGCFHEELADKMCEIWDCLEKNADIFCGSAEDCPFAKRYPTSDRYPNMVCENCIRFKKFDMVKILSNIKETSDGKKKKG